MYLYILLLEGLVHVPLKGFDEITRLHKLEHLGLQSTEYPLQLERDGVLIALLIIGVPVCLAIKYFQVKSPRRNSGDMKRVYSTLFI